MKTLTLNLKAEWFNAIKDGSKTEEYRLYNDYWKKRLFNKDFNQVVFCLGYPKRDDNSRRITAQYKGYEVKTITHEFFNNVPTKVFAIQFERLENDNG